MDKTELENLLYVAVQEGKFPPEVLSITNGEYSFDLGNVSRSNMLHIYRRRLKRTPQGSSLHVETERLVALLEQLPDDEISMIGIRTQEEDDEMFLADLQESRILFWMKMFSRRGGRLVY